MQSVRVNTERCIELANSILAAGGVPEDREDPMPYSFPKTVAPNAWCAIVAINHQTTPVAGKRLVGEINGTTLRGWDFLLQKAIETSRNNNDMFKLPWLCNVTGKELVGIFGPTLGNPAQRAELLRDLGRTLKKMNMQSVFEIYERSDGYIVRSDGNGIAQLLARARAYQDPVKKKLFYFLALMRNQGFWEYRDPINLSSPINYHEQRGHFRLGTVEILNLALEGKIRKRQNITAQEDIEIRSTVLRAVEFMAQYLNVTPSMMHYFFWNHFRNCCTQDAPHCASCPETCALPERYRAMSHCIFASACPSAQLPTDRLLIQPRIDDTIWQ